LKFKDASGLIIIAILAIITSMAILVFLRSFQGNVITLNGTEVREYNGTDLSSINDFRENSIKGPQYIDANRYRLDIAGLVENPKTLTYGEILSHQRYRKVVGLDCVEGWSVNILWEGVLVKDLLNEVIPKSGTNTVIFWAYDGYSSSFPLDYFMGDKGILLAYKMNNITLPPERGFPFQLVAESKWGYKWVKWITRIELSNDTAFRGYWESRGYSNVGDLDKSFIGG
jgi:DMSO/TMAO reductase YedYZ molybdopterin-dependent catalytic subunit